MASDLMSGSESKSQMAYAAIKQLIVGNEYKPNTLLVERKLSDALGISRTSIRQALHQLANEGFVQYVMNKGMFVADFNVMDAIEIYSIREVLDPLMLENCFIFNYNTLLAKLESSLEIIDEAIRNRDYESYIEHDLEFHSAYINTCTYKRLQVFVLSMMEQVVRFAHLSQDYERALRSAAQHRKIMEAYRDRDIEKAKILMAEHMQEVKKYFISKIG